MAATKLASGHVYMVKRARGAQWYMKYRTPDGRQVQKRIGPAWTKRTRPPAGFFTKRQAERTLADVLDAANEGRLTGTQAGHTFGEACAEYLRYSEQDRECAETTMRSYRSDVLGVLRPALGADTPLSAITVDTVKALRAELVARNLSDRTVQKHVTALYSILECARRERWIAANPAADVPRRTKKASGKLGAFLSPVEVMAVARAATCQQDAALFIVAAFTGLRQGELRALRWSDVDFAGQVVRVYRNLPANGSEKLPKSGMVRSVPLVPQALAQLDRLHQRGHLTGGSDHVFINTEGGPLHGDTMRDAFYDALDAAGLGHLRSKTLPRAERMTFHSLRHTFGTMAAREMELTEVQGYMGHADYSTTKIYVHHVPRAAAAAQLGQAIAAELGPDVSQTVSRTSPIAA